MRRQRTEQHWIEPDNKYHRGFHNFFKELEWVFKCGKTHGFRLLPYTSFISINYTRHETGF
jgi:hypothetical protein